MAPNRRRPQPGGDCGASEKVSASGFDFPRNTVPHSKRQAATRGLIPLGEIAAEIVANLRFRRQVQRVHALGPRAVAELLAEIGAERSIRTIIDRKLDTYAEIDPAAIEATGGDGFWPLPLREV